tara:strand:- start:3676 stop:4527 length:852 start_codon:yes stop_codon:yes gene_type:complete
MKIGIVGYGFVGKALANGLRNNVQTCLIDPKLKTSVGDLVDFNPDAIFLCLPTPMSDDGNQDISILKMVLEELKSYKINSLIVIKSTVLPENIEVIENIYTNFVYNPEFLREKHANDDFINSKLIVFGGKDSNIKYLADIYKNHSKCLCQDYVFTDLISASMIKYTINSFLATKVIFFNEIHSLFKKVKTSENWDNFISYLSLDKRIGDSHMQVPGHDGRLGFGGACLPKDSSAILKYAESLNVEMSLIRNVIETNNKIRSSYKDKTDREEDQNISFRSNKKE